MKLRAFYILAVGASMAFGISSCDDKYGDDLRALGQRVEILEDSLLEENKAIVTIQTILYTVETDGFITRILPNPNGTYTITFNNGNTVTLRHGNDGEDGQDGIDGKDGKDGSADNFNISVAKGEDEVWYWTLNGQWIIGNDGNRMRAGALDGKDGKNGLDGKDGKDDINLSLTLPQVRVNPVTRYWEISIDGGLTYKSTGIYADGEDGKDGSAENFDIKIAKGEDGVWYWTLNGQWILNEDGTRMPAGGIDGKDGEDGEDGKDGKDDINLSLPIPVVRINPITRIWEISTDGGLTYKSTGIKADGEKGSNGNNGQNGLDGRNGRDDTFASVYFSQDGNSVTIVLRDGSRFSIPISGRGASN